MTQREWDQRILCSDGNCIGIIGSDGRCKTCGLPHDGERPIGAANADDAGDDLPAQELIADEVDDVGTDPATAIDTSDDLWENRTLCIDQSCIGVIGPDGRCKECGKPYPGSRP